MKTENSIIEIFTAFRRLNKSTSVYINKMLAPYEVTIGSYSYLLALLENGPMTLTQISKYLVVDNTLTTRVVSHLVKQKYLIRKKNSKNKKTVTISLTDQGTVAAQAVENVLSRLNEIAMRGSLPEEATAIQSVLNFVAGNCEEYIFSSAVFEFEQEYLCSNKNKLYEA